MDDREKVLEFIINQTNYNLIIKMVYRDTDLDKNTTKQPKKLERTNERYLTDHEIKKTVCLMLCFLMMKMISSRITWKNKTM